MKELSRVHTRTPAAPTGLVARDCARPLGTRTLPSPRGIAVAADPVAPTATITWVQGPVGVGDDGPTRRRVDMREGESVDFGRDPSSGAFRPDVSPRVGSFEVEDERLYISNFTTSTTFVLENLEGGSELIKARPRHLRMPVPFEMSRILIPSGMDVFELTAFGPEPSMLDAGQATDDDDAPLPRLDTASKYFAVLVALCEPRLRGNSMAAVPSVQELVARLEDTDLFHLPSRSSINYHIDYLVEQKVPVTRWAKYGDDGRRHSKREALVAFALRFDLVCEEHLDLLPQLPRPA